MATKPAPNKGKAAPPPAKKPPLAPPQRAAAPPPQREAAPPPAETAEKGGEVAVRASAGMSTDFAQAMSEHASGQGLSQAADDNLVPLMYILQKLSPQVEPKKAEYIEGAKVGQIWLKQTGVFDADISEQADGLIAQPCHFSKWIMEWIPREQGGGLVGRYDMQIGETAEQALNRHQRTFDRIVDPKNPKRTRLVTPDGHELIETREHVCRIFIGNDPNRATAAVVTMSGTNHTVSRGWMMTMNSKSMNGQRLNSYTSLYRLRTKWNQNDQGDWFNYVVDDLGRLDEVGEAIELDWSRELAAGKALADAFGTGEKKTNVDDYKDDATAQGGESFSGHAQDGEAGQVDETDPI
jgi:hypothetical protein